MSDSSNQRSEDFLRISDQFQLGVLTTESSHPTTANLSQTAKQDVSEALRLLFEVDIDVVRKFRDFVDSGRARPIQEALLNALRGGGKLFFTGCGSTGRLSIQLVSIWRDFWQQQRARGLQSSPSAEEFENRAFSVMAGGDFALIKAVEGFEDFTEFGKKQIGDLGVSSKDVVFAITARHGKESRSAPKSILFITIPMTFSAGTSNEAGKSSKSRALKKSTSPPAPWRLRAQLVCRPRPFNFQSC
jgi:N-acetylmuramic acid 6-phosphate etherase